MFNWAFLFSPPDDSGAATPEGTIPAASTTATPETNALPEAPSGAAAPEPSAPSTPTPAQPSWLSHLRESGLGEYSDEQSAITALRDFARQRQEMSQYQPWVQSYVQNAAAFSRWQQEEAQRRQTAQVSPQGHPDASKPWHAKYWQPPEFNPQWQSLLTTDQNGNIALKPGTPPEVLGKYQAYMQFRQEQAQKLMNNPHEYFEPSIRELARQEAQTIVQAQLGQHTDVQKSNQFVRENNSWLYEFDQNGSQRHHPVFNPMTQQMVMQPVLSPWGQLFAQTVQQEAARQSQRGYSDYEEQKRIAMMQVQLQYLASLQGQQGQPQTAPQAPVQPQVPQTARQAANNRFLNQNNPPATGAASPGAQNPAQQKITRKNLLETLAARLKEAGVTNETLQNEILNAGRQ